MERAERDQRPRETETKLRLPDRGAFEERLRRLGARPVRSDAERNTLYDDAAGSLRGRGAALRLRTTEHGALLTYKGEPFAVEGVKSRLELESPVARPEAIDELLREIGFLRAFVYEKRRTTWRFDGASRPLVVVDETPLGLFAEIEGDDAAVRALASELGFAPADLIAESYVALWEKARKDDPSLPKDMVFAAPQQS